MEGACDGGLDVAVNNFDVLQVGFARYRPCQGSEAVSLHAQDDPPKYSPCSHDNTLCLLYRVECVGESIFLIVERA